MSEELIFLLGLAVGLITMAVVWRVEWTMRHTKAERAVESSTEQAQERVMAILDSLPQSYILLDSEGRVMRASKLARSYGLLLDQGLQANVAELVDAAAGGAPGKESAVDTEFDLVRPLKHGSHSRRIWVRVAKVHDDFLVVLFEDHTDKLRLEATRRDFVANISHELKTPIGALKLLAETIVNVSDEPELVRKFAGRLEAETSRLADLVHEIIQLSRLQEGDALANPELVDVDAVVSEAISRVQVEAESRHIDLVSGGRGGLQVYGDYSLLVTAVRNLLDNAVRYSNPHSRVSVAVSASEHNKRVKIAVIDAGEGIPDELKDRVFERFYRADSARSRETGGSGLGLSIVKHVVADHGGEVKLWSEVGRGSTFTISLPLVTASAHQQREGSAQ